MSSDRYTVRMLSVFSPGLDINGVCRMVRDSLEQGIIPVIEIDTEAEIADSVPKHPLQPLVVDDDGVARFKEKQLHRFLRLIRLLSTGRSVEKIASISCS